MSYPTEQELRDLVRDVLQSYLKEDEANYPSEYEAREQICEVGRRLFEKDMVAANDGNISVKIGKDLILATPTGVSKGFMKPEMMSILDLKGNIVKMGTIKPSSEVKMHLRIYNENPKVGACVHAHPVNATCYAITGEWLNAPIFAEAILQLGVVPVAEYGTPGTQEVPDSVAPFANKYNACLLAFHGALTWGDDLFQAYYRMEALEHLSMVYTRTKYIMNNKKYMTSEQVEACTKIRESWGAMAGGIPDNRS